jgi:fatty acid desaturase
MPVHDVHPVLRAALGRVCAPVPEGRVLIHGRLYDLRHFDHPGGRVWTHMCDGCDATALFETHHLDAAAAWRVLRALPSRPAPSTALWRYDFVRYAKLRDAALHALPRRCDRGPTGAVRWATAGSAVGALLGHMWLLRCAGGQGTIAYATACVASAGLNTLAGGYGHNALHGLRPASVLLDWNGLSCLEWLHEHVHSHHMYVNTRRDHDAIAMEPFLNWIPGARRGSLLGPWGKHALYAIGEIVVATHGTFGHRLRWRALADPAYPWWIRLAPLLFLARAASHVAVEGALRGAATLLLCMALASYAFSALAHLNHAGPGALARDDPEGEAADGPESLGSRGAVVDFVDQQLGNTADIQAHTWTRPLLLFLDRQTLHHLFPAIDHSRLPQLREPMLGAGAKSDGGTLWELHRRSDLALATHAAPRAAHSTHPHST